MTTERYNTIIVGAGIAGLTSAAYLSRSGQKVMLLEKNKDCGGLVNSFSRDGFVFDAGVRALEDAGIIFPMLKDLGIELEFVESPVSVGIEKDILHIESIESLSKYREQLIRFYPESEDEIDNVLRIIRRIMKHMDVLYGVENPVFKNLKSDTDFILKQLLPWLPKFIFTVGRINRMNMPVEAYLDSLINNRSLRDIISQHFFKNTPTFFALSYFSLYLDYFYPKGGVGKLAGAVEKKIREFGGKIITGCAITGVNPSEAVIEDQNGIAYQYDDLVWAADLKTFYNLINTKGLPDKVQNGIDETRAKMQRNRGGDSVFTLFLEVNEPLESFKKISNGHFFYTPSSRGLGSTHWEDLNRLLEHFDELDKADVLKWLDRFIELNTFEISIPGLKDPDLVPPGKTGLIISMLAEYDLFKKAEQAGWYDEFTSEFEKRIISVMAGSIYPMLKDKVKKRFSFSPLNIEKRVGSSEGAITGWSFQKPLPVVHKIQYSDRSVLTPFPNIYQAGQWAYSPAGVPMSILTGKLAADKIVKARK